jgi:hypothetical protein
MMIKKQDVRPDNVARFSPGNARGAMPAGIDRAMPPSSVTHPATVSKRPVGLHCITATDMAFIAHDLPRPVVRDVIGQTVDQEPTSRIDWDGIAIGALLVGFLILAGTVLFKVAAFSAIAGLSV